MVTPHLTSSNSQDLQAVHATRSVVVQSFNALARVVLLAVLMLAPWFFGGVYADVQYKLYLAVLAALAIWIPGAIWDTLVTGAKNHSVPSAIVPLIGCLILGAYQLADGQPIPSDLQPPTSHATAENDPELTKTSLIHALQTHRSISLSSTRLAQQRLVFAIATFLLGSQLFATQASQLWLWGTFALNGSALAFFGIAQQLSWNGRLFWMVPLRHGGHPFSSFVNRNNAAGYLCICLAGALGLLVATLSHRSNARRSTFIRPQTRLQDRLAEFIQSIVHLSASQLIGCAFVILIATAIVATSSRGGWLALATATIVTTFVASRSRGLSVVVFVVVAMMLAVGLINMTGLDNRISQRIRSAASTDAIAGDGRWLHWSDSSSALRDFPLTGTGYGTYQFAYLPYQTHSKVSHLRFYHADNQFLEWLVEGGLVGFSLVLTTCLSLMIAIVALLRRSDLRDPVGLAGIFLLVSQCVSSSFDYGPTMPANMLAIAAMSGAIVGRAALLASQNEISAGKWLVRIPALRPFMIVPLFAVPLLIMGVFGLKVVHSAAMTDSIFQKLPNFESLDEMDYGSVVERIGHLKDAILHNPDDVNAHQALANLWIYKFRLEELEIAKKNHPTATAIALWPLTHPSVFYSQANHLSRTGQFERIESLVESPTIQANLVPAYDELQKVQAYCAWAPDVDLDLAMLAFVTHPQDCNGEGHLRRAILLAPASPLAYYQVGILAQSAGLTDFSFSCLKKSLELSPAFLLPIHDAISPTLSLDEEIDLVLPDSANLLVELASKAYVKKNQRAGQHLLANRAVELLSAGFDGKAEGEHRHLLGKAKLMLGDYEEAMEEYRHALTLVPDQTDWRIELVRMIEEFKGIHWALREAEIGVAVSPDHKQLQTLVRELRTKLNYHPNQPISSSNGRN